MRASRQMLVGLTSGTSSRRTRHRHPSVLVTKTAAVSGLTFCVRPRITGPIDHRRVIDNVIPGLAGRLRSVGRCATLIPAGISEPIAVERVKTRECRPSKAHQTARRGRIVGRQQAAAVVIAHIDDVEQSVPGEVGPHRAFAPAGKKRFAADAMALRLEELRDDEVAVRKLAGRFVEEEHLCGTIAVEIPECDLLVGLRERFTGQQEVRLLVGRREVSKLPVCTRADEEPPDVWDIVEEVRTEGLPIDLPVQRDERQRAVPEDGRASVSFEKPRFSAVEKLHDWTRLVACDAVRPCVVRSMVPLES